MGRSDHLVIRDGEDDERIPAAQTRARLLRAARRFAAGIDTEETVEAEAGAILEAETAVEIHEIHDMIRGYLDGLPKR